MTYENGSPIVCAPCGDVRGEERGGVAIFRGIPYGANCDGEGRFLPAAPAAKWGGVRDCVKNGPIAVQHGGSISGSAALGAYFSGGEPEKFGVADEEPSENCLVLNVLTPGTDGEKRPVLFYIHGGGFSNGTGSIVLGAEKLAREENLVIVGVNHRLNVFGYCHLAHLSPKYADSALVGISDLVLALRWVKENIASFGGDPEKVTIMGESGGGAKVNTLMAMPEAKGLFCGAIVESGSNPPGAFLPEEAKRMTDALMERLGLENDDIEGLLRVPAQKLLDCAENPALPPLKFAPVADGVRLPRNEGRTFELAASREIPVMVGASEDERAVFSPKATFEITEETLRDALLQNPKLEYVNKENVDEVIALYRKMSPKELSAEHLYLYIVSTETILGWNAHLQAQEKARQGGTVYQYLVRYDAAHPTETGRRYSWHTADLPLQLRIVLCPESEELSRIYARAWAQFARTGNPSTPELPWPEYTADGNEIMVFDEVCHVEREPMKALFDFHKGRGALRMEEL